MAMLEVFGKRSITTYEVGDAGNGVELRIWPVGSSNPFEHDGRHALKFGPRVVGYVPDLVDDPMGLEIGQAISAVGEPAGWNRVTLNGSIVWESAAIRAAKAALAEAKRKAKEAEKEAAKKAKEEAEKTTGEADKNPET